MVGALSLNSTSGAPPTLLIGRHGVDAELEAARMADAMLDRGDIDGQRVWRRIRLAIVELQARPQGKPN
jgi:hypothetical protein